MPETICPQCGAVATTNGDFRICPHCGHDFSKTFPKIPLVSVYWLPPGLIFVAGSAPLLSAFFQVEWKYWVIAGFVLALGLGWVFVARKFRREYYDPTASLNVYAKERNGRRDEIAPVRARMPETPRIWKPLVSVPRPREVYLPSGAKFAFLFGAFSVFLLGVGLLWASVHHRGAFAHGVNWSRGWAPLFNFLGVALGSLFMAWREATSRKLLRDGEVTIGYWNEGAYEFWTQSGQRFRHDSSLVPSSDAITDVGLVPVFYVPHDPTKSVALCSVYSRVRIPSEEQFHGMARVSARP
jgi:hypothetical protein